MSTEREVDHLIVHATATEHGQEVSAADVDRWHRQRGWLGNGYHFHINLDGTIESRESGHRLRPLDKPGAHVGDCGPGWNRRTIGIVMAGGLKKGKPSGEFTDEQFDSLYELINDLDDEYTFDVIEGHRDLIKRTGAPPKACPCFDVQSWLEERDAVFTGKVPLRDNFDQS